VLYLLSMNKAARNNKSSMEDYLDFERMRAGSGLETMTMKDFLSTVAMPGLLSQPLPDNNTELIKDPLWTYLESACYTRKWSTGKTFLAFNLSKAEESTSLSGDEDKFFSGHFGTFEGVEKERMDLITLNSKRKMVHYDEEFHSNRAVYLSGHAANRILTHWYGYFFFAEPKVERSAKRFMRDRVRYHDVIFCAAGRVIDLILSEVTMLRNIPRADDAKNILTMDEIHRKIGYVVAMPFVSYSPSNDDTHSAGGGGGGDSDVGGVTDSGDSNSGDDGGDDEIDSRRVYRLLALNNSYIAYHIRRGDFQQKQTRLEAADILNITLKLLPNNPEDWVVYIATDERNRTFFREFERTFRSVRFLHDYENHADLRDINKNHQGMIEQVVCANAHTFIGTPLSTFTSYITRMRGYMAKTILVETNPSLPSTLLSDVQRYNIRYNSRMKQTPSEPAVMLPLLHKQIGVPIQKRNQGSEKLVGKIFTTSNEKVKNNVIPYNENDEKSFTTDLLLHSRTLYKRSTATIQQSPSTILSFLTEKYLTDMKLKDKEEVPSSTPLGVSIYQRTYYFIDRFEQQLHAHPRLMLPFWVREFSDAFLDTEEKVEYVPA
jgi:GDP-fucose protein O-fucosyltransferase